jgi:hypothetical protein
MFTARMRSGSVGYAMNMRLLASKAGNTFGNFFSSDVGLIVRHPIPSAGTIRIRFKELVALATSQPKWHLYEN